MGSEVLAFIIGVGVLLFNSESESKRIHYDNYKIFAVTATNKDQLEVLKNLDGVTFVDSPPHTLDKSVNILISSQQNDEFLQKMKEKQFSYKLIESSVQEKLETFDITPRSGEYNWQSYQTLPSTYSWLRSLPFTYPNIASVFTVGNTYEGRQILGVKLSHKSGNPGIFIEGGIHAREWIAPATVTYILNQLLTSDNEEIREIAKNYDWYFIPHANPDGYVYSQIDRFWRKSRSPQYFCYGVELNRNWNIYWREADFASSHCSNFYPGQYPFSEPETKSLSEYLKLLKDKIHLYLSFHSFGQIILYPYGYSFASPPNHLDLIEIADAAVAAIQKRYNTTYTHGSISNAISPAFGSSLDWIYSVLGINLTFCYELRPNLNRNRNNFILPANQIIPVGKETFDSIQALINKAKQLNYLRV